MKKRSSAEIRDMWLKFFEEKGHRVEPSASLVPYEDPTLLWINSGVATLKKYFDGREIPVNPRIVNAQKAIRTNDIENVGKTARHHTFFEMLGNFSIGDYFRKDAIAWGWEFLTSDKWCGFPAEKLYVTVYPEDKETYNTWVELGLNPEHIVLLEGNFWEIGEGPCGPCTEIFYDRGMKYDPKNQGIRLLQDDLENDRYIEIWNIVLSQFNAKDGLKRSEYPELPNKNIDTGCGLERMACIMQGVDTNFDTDLFMPIIQKTESISGKKYGVSKADDIAFKVIADHIRTVAFAISDDALPSNEGRGYVLRRLLRRAVRYAKNLGIEKPFMASLVPVVGEIMESYYPQILEKQVFIEKMIHGEEIRFLETLNEGLHILSDEVKRLKADKCTVIPGTLVFKLYDTYGFPMELTEEYAEDDGMTIDIAGFEKEMEKQRERARNARQEVESMQVQNEILTELKDESTFVGYTKVAATGTVVAILQDGKKVDMLEKDQEGQVVFNETPFYSESGGQVADTGIWTNDTVTVEVLDVQKAPNGQGLHQVKITKGTLKIGDTCLGQIDKQKRNAIIKNHTATHLLHQALKDVLGTHVNQAGSQVAPERLRFDFSHFGAIEETELKQIETIVNEKIWASIPLEIESMPIAEAKEKGAMALFGEKYGEIVRVVSIGDYSLELCGGCHVSNTNVIGLFKIVSESGIGAGIRRIEAVTGEYAYRYMNMYAELAEHLAKQAKSTVKGLPAKIAQLQTELRTLQKTNESLTAKISHMQSANLIHQVKDVGSVSVIAAVVPSVDMNHLRQMVDDLKNRIESVIIVLGCTDGEKVNLTIGITKDLVKQGYHAGKLIKEVAAICGGGGGGRPDMAQAGGKNPDSLHTAIEAVTSLVQEQKK